MRKLLATIGVAFGLSLAVPLAASAAVNCTPTGFVRDGINLTAASINPGTVSGTTINATGCNVGIYYGPGQTGKVQNSQVYGANYFGVLNNGGQVNVTGSNVHDIGEVPFNGTQHGVGIYFAYNTGATGIISGNTVSRYQKGGIVVNGGSDSATISGNTVTGLGRVNYIAQNGIQLGFGAHGNINGNKVSGNAYTGANNAFSTGLLVFGGCGDPMITDSTISGNTVTNNDVGIYVVNTPENDCSNPPATPTSNTIAGNRATNDAVTNISGYGSGQGYQAGITEYGNHDRIVGNTISGAGYHAQNTPSVIVVPIDTSGSVGVFQAGNQIH